MDREEIVNSKEYIFAKEACKYSRDQDAIQAFEDGAEYGYKYAVEKACKWLEDNYPYYFETDIEQEFIRAMKGE